MSGLKDHWASKLEIGDKAFATIRHDSDGSKNIYNVVVIVIKNIYHKNEVMAAIEDSVYTIPYNDLSEYHPFEVSSVKCDLCANKWVAVRPVGVNKLECPNCRNIANFENTNG